MSGGAVDVAQVQCDQCVTSAAVTSPLNPSELQKAYSGVDATLPALGMSTVNLETGRSNCVARTAEDDTVHMCERQDVHEHEQQQQQAQLQEQEPQREQVLLQENMHYKQDRQEVEQPTLELVETGVEQADRVLVPSEKHIEYGHTGDQLTCPSAGPTAECSIAENQIAQSRSDVSDVGGQLAEESVLDRETFTGLGIENRECTAEAWEEEVKSIAARVVPFSRIRELGGRSNQNHLVIGVLYECSSTKFSSGATYLQWGLTDLADPKPRRIQVQLWGNAHTTWKRSRFDECAARGTIFALLNPELVHGSGPVAGSTCPEYVLRVENLKGEQIMKLGRCPWLGTCVMKACQMPLRADLGHRVCMTHLNQLHAEKIGRMSVGGKRVDEAKVAPRKRFTPKPTTEDETVKDVQVVVKAKLAMATHLEHRRLLSNNGNRDYVKTVCRGGRSEDCSTSKMPVLGRALNEESTLELDLSTLDVSEKHKASRMVEHRAVREREDAELIVKRARTEKAPAMAPKQKERSLGELLKVITKDHAPRRPPNAGRLPGPQPQNFCRPGFS